MSSFKYLTGTLPAIVAAVPAMFSLPATAQMVEIEEIVVTTRRREENIQDLPISVTAISADTIERTGISDLNDITKLSSSVQFDTAFGPGDTRITIRGLSPTRGRSNVAFLVDGIDVTTENTIAAGSGLLANKRLLNDVERIEIIKGPQSALYGRAAFSGAISYVTKEPGDEFEGEVGFELAEDDIWQTTLAVGGPLSETVGVRFNALGWGSSGHYNNSVSGGDTGGGDGTAIAGTLVWEPNETFKAKTRLSYSDDDIDQQSTARVSGDTLITFPDTALAVVQVPGVFPPEFVGVSPRSGFSPTVALADHGNTFMIPRSFGESGGKTINLSEDPLTGGEQPGSTLETLRGSLNLEWTTERGTFSSTTGFTAAEFSDRYDQDYQASGRPDNLIAHQQANTRSKTDQISQEFRFSSNLDGPVQFTAGALYWWEDRDVIDQNSIIACLPTGKAATGFPPPFPPTPNSVPTPLIQVGGICDGSMPPPLPPFLPPIPRSVSSWQEYAGQLEPIPPSPWATETEHTSFYAMIEWDISDNWKATFETRYVDEDFELWKPNQSSCTNLGFSLLFGFGRVLVPLSSEAANPGFDALCTSHPNSPANTNTIMFTNIPDTSDDWLLLHGTTNSSFSTPKFTLEWTPTDDSLIFFHAAKAQKPGGINVLSSGSCCTTIDDERFEPEEMNAYELGFKTTHQGDGGGVLQFNGAVFLQDYTDKQIGTQVLVNNVLQPRIVNASAAEVLGVELEVGWRPAALEGLVLTAAYTYQDAEYTDFLDDTRTLVRAGMAGQCPVVYKGQAGPNPGDLTDPANRDPFCRLNLSGNKLDRAPEGSFVGTISLQRPMPSGQNDWFFEAVTTWQDDRFLDADNFVKFDAYWLTDVRFGVTNDRWSVLAFVNNVFEDDTIKSGGSGPDFAQQVSELGFTAGLGVTQFFARMPDPRIMGIRANFNF